MKINRQLNIVIPVEVEPEEPEVKDDDGKVVKEKKDAVVLYVHAEPIRKETFEAFFDIFGKAFTQIYMGGYSLTSGPRLAKLIITQIAKNTNRWDGPMGVEKALFPEIRRLTNVIMPVDGRWNVIPFEDAIKSELLSEDDLSEVENALCFFTVASVMNKKTELRLILDGMSFAWGSLVSSLNCTDFAATLKTSTEGASFGKKMPLSFIPS